MIVSLHNLFLCFEVCSGVFFPPKKFPFPFPFPAAAPSTIYDVWPWCAGAWWISVSAIHGVCTFFTLCALEVPGERSGRRRSRGGDASLWVLDVWTGRTGWCAAQYLHKWLKGEGLRLLGDDGVMWWRVMGWCGKCDVSWILKTSLPTLAAAKKQGSSPA